MKRRKLTSANRKGVKFLPLTPTELRKQHRLCDTIRKRDTTVSWIRVY